MIDLLQLLSLLYANDITLLAETAQELQKSLDALENYCDRWKLTVNDTKRKKMYLKRVVGYLMAYNLLIKDRISK